MFSEPNRYFWSTFFSLSLLLVMVLAALVAVHQARVLYIVAVEEQTEAIPFSRGLAELEANLTALRGSDALVRAQSTIHLVDIAELMRGHNYMAQILEELVDLAALPLSDAQHAALYALHANVTRFQRQHDEFIRLVNGDAYAEAVAHYDSELAAPGVAIAKEVSDFIGLKYRWELNASEVAINAYTATYWAIFGCVGAALGAGLLLVARSMRWKRSSSTAAPSLLSQR